MAALAHQKPIIPAFFAFHLTEPVLILSVLVALIAFSLLASAVYVFNDWIDRHEDAQHPEKRHRAIAAGLQKLKWHQAHGYQIVIVSASTEYWLKPWTIGMGFDLLATQLDIKDKKLTGCYLGENCHGEEKVLRIEASYDLAKFDKIYAYGDTSGDKPMLELAQEQFFKPFR